MIAATSCGEGGSAVPDEAKSKAVGEIGGTVEDVYGEGAWTLGEALNIEGKRADDVVYGVLVSGDFKLESGPTGGPLNLTPSGNITAGSGSFSTALIVFDETGKALETRYWVDARPDPPPFGKHIPKADALVFDPSVLIEDQ